MNCRFLTDESKFYKDYLNKSDTEVEFEILFIASPIRLEIGKTSMFLTFLVLSLLSKYKYSGNFIFQTARTYKGNHINLMQEYYTNLLDSLAIC